MTRHTTLLDDADADVPEHVHDWELVEDEEGDPREAHLYVSYSYYACSGCDETRDVREIEGEGRYS
jgi:hypothetical protein